MTELSGYEQWRRTGMMLKSGRGPSSRKAITDMTLKELEEIQRKWFYWETNNKQHSEYPRKKHIYENYIIPRIQMLRGDLDPAKEQRQDVKAVLL